MDDLPQKIQHSQSGLISPDEILSQNQTIHLSNIPSLTNLALSSPQQKASVPEKIKSESSLSPSPDRTLSPPSPDRTLSPPSPDRTLSPSSSPNYLQLTSQRKLMERPRPSSLPDKPNTSLKLSPSLKRSLSPLSLTPRPLQTRPSKFINLDLTHLCSDQPQAPAKALLLSQTPSPKRTTTQPSSADKTWSSPPVKRVKRKKRRKKMSLRNCKHLCAPSSSRHFCKIHLPSTSEDSTASEEDDWDW